MSQFVFGDQTVTWWEKLHLHHLSLLVCWVSLMGPYFRKTFDVSLKDWKCVIIKTTQPTVTLVTFKWGCQAFCFQKPMAMLKHSIHNVQCMLYLPTNRPKLHVLYLPNTNLYTIEHGRVVLYFYITVQVPDYVYYICIIYFTELGITSPL